MTVCILNLKSQHETEDRKHAECNLWSDVVHIRDSTPKIILKTFSVY